MSIAADIKRDRANFEAHVAEHGCRPRSAALAADQVPCKERINLWREWVHTAGLWGQEPTDEQRQRDHFNRNLRPAAA